ncbi:MAG: succinylglutamate desuccinylase/aspartoacylase family protein [Pseudomonadota bacterium]|nr:succinylglutamate desuccinylase/aspartoacylase family protein [Pseudomonadota bacterium]
MGDDLSIPYHDLGPADRPPRLALVAGLHGRPLNGMFVLSRLAAFLKDIADGRRPRQRLCERVVIVPAAAAATLDGPGRLSGSEAAADPRRTAAVLALTRPAYYRVDLHDAAWEVEEMPQVCLYAPNDDERASACLFGLPAVVEQPLEESPGTALVFAWRACGGENFVIQAGQAGHLQPYHCDLLFRALVGFLTRTGIVDGLALAADEDDLHYFGLHQTFAVTASQAGIFVSRLAVGRWVQAGHILGHIYDGFTGDIRTQVFAPVSGLVSSLRRQPLLFEGDMIARIQTVREPAGGQGAPSR